MMLSSFNLIYIEVSDDEMNAITSLEMTLWYNFSLYF